MKRRSFITSLLALPVVAVLFPRKQNPEFQEVVNDGVIYNTYEPQPYPRMGDIMEQERQLAMLRLRRGGLPISWETIMDTFNSTNR